MQKKRQGAFELSCVYFILLFSSAILHWFCFNRMRVKLLSLNVRGISNFKKRKTIFTWCRKQKADFIFLQETYSKIDSERCWRDEWGGEIIMAHGSSNSRGVAILVKKNVDCTIHSKILDPSGQFVIIKTEIKDKMYVLINIFAPNKDPNIVSLLTICWWYCKKKTTLMRKRT